MASTLSDRIAKLRDRRAAIEAELPERKLAALDAELAQVQAEATESANADRAKARQAAEAEAAAHHDKIVKATRELADLLEPWPAMLGRVAMLGGQASRYPVTTELLTGIQAQLFAWRMFWPELLGIKRPSLHERHIAERKANVTRAEAQLAEAKARVKGDYSIEAQHVVKAREEDLRLARERLSELG